MDCIDFKLKIDDYTDRLKSAFDALDKDQINDVMNILLKTYENVFSMQLEGKLKKGDVIFAISGSGNSKNVIKAIEYAKAQGNEIVSLTGYSGGKLLELSDHPIHVNINDMQIAEDVHMMLCHMMSSIIAKKFGYPMC